MQKTTAELPKSVMIIDDEPGICDSLSEIIKLLEYKTVTAHDCNEAVISISRKLPDIVFLDIQLPVVDGVTILKLLRLIDPELPVVMMSGVASVDVAKETLSNGAFDYITKPFTLDRITDVLRAIELSDKNNISDN